MNKFPTCLMPFLLFVFERYVENLQLFVSIEMYPLYFIIYNFPNISCSIKIYCNTFIVLRCFPYIKIKLKNFLVWISKITRISIPSYLDTNWPSETLNTLNRIVIIGLIQRKIQLYVSVHVVWLYVIGSIKNKTSWFIPNFILRFSE